MAVVLRATWAAPPLLSLLRVLALLRLALPVEGLRFQDSEGHQSSDGQQVKPFMEALRELAQRRGEGQLCLYSPGPFVGRLSNTVAMVNVALRAAVDSGARYVWPSHYTEYFEQEGFDDIFGKGDDGPCKRHQVEVYSPVCPPGGVKVPASVGRCSTAELLMSTVNSHSFFSDEMCGCRRAVYIDGNDLFWDHNYTRTAALLSRRYWASHREPLTLPVAPGATSMESMRGKKPQVVMHVRLGDIEKNCELKFTPYNCRKKLQVEVYELTLKALFSVLPPSCVDVNLATDGHGDSPDIVRLTKTMAAMGLPAPRVWTGSDLSTAKTFQLLTHADVLVFGSSGFGRLAAILGRPENVRIGAPQPRGHDPNPVPFLPNTTQLRHPVPYLAALSGALLDMEEATRELAKNQALQALARSCRS